MTTEITINEKRINNIRELLIIYETHCRESAECEKDPELIESIVNRFMKTKEFINLMKTRQTRQVENFSDYSQIENKNLYIPLNKFLIQTAFSSQESIENAFDNRELLNHKKIKCYFNSLGKIAALYQGFVMIGTNNIEYFKI